MASGDPKFASEIGGQWLPHDYGHIYAHEQTSSSSRLAIAASHQGSRLLQTLTQILRAPFWLLYVLVIPRGGSSEGRYQSAELSPAELDSLFQEFGPFWDGDGRHSVWIRSSADDATLIYDRHNLIYCYGLIDRIESLLRSLGYLANAQISLNFVHQHSYHAHFDGVERELVKRLADNHSELRSGDENPTA